MWIRLLAGLLLALGVPGCAGMPFVREEPPRGRLPRDVRPLRYALELTILPARDSFSGTVAIDLELDGPRRLLWLHGDRLEVEAIWIEAVAAGGAPERVAARYTPEDPSGVAAVRLAHPIGPGRATLHVAWHAPFGRALRGLYRVEQDGEPYVFSQLEPVDARRVFPGFDEPSFKVPFDVALTVPADAVAIANTPAVEEIPGGDGTKRLRFATTRPLPTYLLAFAVGPLDVVGAPPIPPGGPRERPLPFRGVATRGRGGELAYALANTPPLLAELEDYFAIAYPYAKLDVIAVPDFGAGAMENPGAILFREVFLLVDGASASEWQRRGFHVVMAHELAHMWFGNLVTPPWWDDIWLNESFATWLSYRTLDRVVPEQGALLSRLEGVYWAMDVDALASARRIRQPIESSHDIQNAFDAITYSKGAGVLAMFERWLSASVFRDGVRRFLRDRRDGTGTTGDLLAALGDAAGRDVATPFETFLEQPGVPLLELERACGARGGAALRVQQSRYAPLGSRAEPDGRWSVPVCVRHGVGDEMRETCALVEAPESAIPLSGGCPDWVMPNADAAGYYRWALGEEDAARLRTLGWPSLSPAERLSFASNLEAAFRAGRQSAGAVYGAAPLLARDPTRQVAEGPMVPLRLARERLVDEPLRPAVEGFARALYAPVLARLGWDPAPDEDGETRLLRADVVRFLVQVARDPVVRAEARRRGLRWAGLDGAGPPDPDAVAPDLLATVLEVAVAEGGASDFDALEARLHETTDSVVRGALLAALGEARAPALSERARALALDPRVRVNEALAPLWQQVAEPELRDAAWEWITAHFESLAERVGGSGAGQLPGLATGFCDEGRAAEVATFFAPRIEALPGGPRDLASALEQIRLCAALVEVQGPPTRAFFEAFASELERGAARSDLPPPTY